ncbi:GFA family protein [Lichenifustis flavocetrariae]|uniref:GFA family protein n=1 Tax=Lichenifustis flavocetrariae TaxID=2949735 RepID=A0AA41Z3F2_9HYPH|nr:GFA family protein [Lichenifustis flavocetrariae]MCW6509788.1 GFA family protein [Lichenifustis flavocetrariae]
MSEPATPPPSRLSGGCQCGAVRYCAVGAPVEVSVCHCRMCQKAGGGPFLAFAKLPLASVEWTRGAPAIFKSSNIATRGFCAMCGTPLAYQWQPDAISLTTGSFDEPAAIQPSVRYGMEGLLPWSESLAGLPADTTDNWLAPGSNQTFVNHQHPDHDT